MAACAAAGRPHAAWSASRYSSRQRGLRKFNIIFFPVGAKPTRTVLANGQPNCGGMVLTARHVLSAAHCFISQNGAAISPSVFTVRVGSTYSMSGGSVHKVSTIVLHESYNNPTSNNDVAVVVLASRIRSFNSSTVRPAIVPPSGYVVPDNASVVAIGWGRTVQLMLNNIDDALRGGHSSKRRARRHQVDGLANALTPPRSQLVELWHTTAIRTARRPSRRTSSRTAESCGHGLRSFLQHHLCSPR
ncbi:unnamed protein product [Plutella xylostella]|uniref:(diamondback moth) hypothetical protein n=1 Tax=Plutella xylostella TaxID=51655 RepID=A0A8S4E2L8_PLUXY|nr:unnamed protein product [Plutella xylostella]